MPYEAVLFDFGGVFTTSPIENFAVFERERGLPEKFLANVIKQNHHANAWAKFERSEISFDAFDKAFAEETKAAGREVAGAELVSLLSLTIHEEMVDALRMVKSAGFKTGCITNTLPYFNPQSIFAAEDRRKEAAAIFDLFDHVIESSKAGVRKPEPRIYEMMCDALNVAPQACVFLDDLGVNLKPARAMGMTTIKVLLGDVSPAIGKLERTLGVALH